MKRFPSGETSKSPHFAISSDMNNDTGVPSSSDGRVRTGTATRSPSKDR